MRFRLFPYLLAAVGLLGLAPAADAPLSLAAPARTVCILPIRDDIAPPLVYLVRRAVKAAMEAGAEALILDMETNGGRFDSTKDIIAILDQFKGLTVTYVNKDAYSAGAFIAVATQRIFMAPQGVIGAAAPVMLSPGGGGVEAMPDTVEAKMVSAVAARVRASAEKNGHNKAVVEAMINKTKKLVIDGETLNEEGNILTLTDQEAARTFGDPPRPLLSSGTVESLDQLLTVLGFEKVRRLDIQATGAERLASWLNTISPLLLIIGIVGIYLEFKTPGFGVPGIVGVTAFALYFLGGYVAGLSGMEWLVVFLAGVVLVGLELFLFPGTLVIGLAGATLMLVALVMAMVDVYPGAPAMSSFGQLKFPLGQIMVSFLVALGAIAILSRILPSTPMYRQMVSRSASGVGSVVAQARRQSIQVGQTGVALSNLRPGGKAQFGEEIIDVMTQGDLVSKGARVRIIGHSGADAVVEPADGAGPGA